MGFWLRNLIFGGILVGLAVYFFMNQDLLMDLEKEYVQESIPSGKEKIDSVAAPKAPVKKQKKETSTNTAAQGISAFYGNILGEPGANGPTIRNNIVYLPELENDLELLLDERMKMVRAYPTHWQGTKDNRPFRLGQTIFQKLSEYAEKDKLTVFWRLNKDFIVKDAFRINKNILNTALQLGKGVEGHFQNGVSVYFCYQSRSLVLIEGTKSYLNERCTLLKSRSY